MGQRIEVLDVDIVEDVAMFDTDRSFGGMEGEAFSTLDEARSATTYPADLAERLMLADGSIRGVFVYSNVVSVNRSGGWDDGAVAKRQSVDRDSAYTHARTRVGGRLSRHVVAGSLGAGYRDHRHSPIQKLSP